MNASFLGLPNRTRENKGGTLHGSRMAAYSQVLTLPGPVEGAKMKVDQKPGMVVSIPKAKS